MAVKPSLEQIRYAIRDARWAYEDAIESDPDNDHGRWGQDNVEAEAVLALLEEGNFW